MSEMAAEVPPVDLEIGWSWSDDWLTVSVENGAAELEVKLDWSHDDSDPGADLDLLLSALPSILIQVHQQLNGQEASNA